MDDLCRPWSVSYKIVIADVCLLSRHQMRYRDLSSLTLGILGIGVIGKRSESIFAESFVNEVLNVQ